MAGIKVPRTGARLTSRSIGSSGPSLIQLEFDRVLQILAGLTTSYLGRKRVESIQPCRTREEAELWIRLTAACRQLAEAGRGIPAMRLEDLSPLLGRLDREGSILEPLDLLEMGKLLVALRTARSTLEPTRDSYPELWARAASLCAFPDLERVVDQTVDPSGEIKDGASSELRRIRRRRETVRERLRTRLEKISSGVKDSVVTLREGRYVLSVLRTEQKHVKGLVLDQSASGSTVFIEPMDSLNDNNALREVDGEERQEIRKILESVTRQLGANGAALEAGYQSLGELDELRARADLARRWACHVPQFSDEALLHLRNARHPLLLEVKDSAGGVVPLTLELRPQARLLLITGPNMGGKTVALKCVGLLSVLACCGFLIPADPESSLPWVNRWIVDIGDDQSLDQDLSTFASHLRRWGDALEQAGTGTMVLLDELGAGTDPAEGAALAQALLEALAETGSLGVVTTHLGSLKEFAAQREGVVNASMIFDGSSQKPTYKMLLGVPGESHALDMAKQLGFPPRIVKRASELLTPEARRVQALVKDLEQQRSELAARLSSLDKTRQAAEAAETEARAKLQKLLDKRAELRARAARQAKEILSRAEQQARNLQATERKNRRAHERVVSREKARLAKLQTAGTPTAQIPGVEPDQVALGDRLWAVPLEGTVEVVEILGANRILVQRGGIRVELPKQALRVAADAESAQTSPNPGVSLPEGDDPAGEIHLLGKRADEAMEILDRAVDQGLLAGQTQLRVIHGFGTGALAKAVQDFCKQSPAVKSFRTGEKGEGGGGATILELID